MLTKEIKKISSDILNEIVLIRRTIHQYPELGFEEFKTSSLISAYLEGLGLKVSKGFAGTGVTGLLEGRSPGMTIAIRADMDALPILEENDIQYASSNQGIMHACGHDVHTAIALGTAHILSKFRDHIKGNVKFIFQPAEEGLGGAKVMIDEGVLTNPKVDAIIALHVSPGIKSGQISISPGPVMASPSEFEIEIIGKGGHAAEPQKTIDPIVLGTNIINLFQTIVSRNINPLKSTVLSVTSFQAGKAFNIIPSRAIIKGTVRTFDPLLDKEISRRMLAIVSSVTGGVGAEYSFDYKLGYPPVINSKKVVDMVVDASSKVINSENIILNEQASMLAEDFSYYLNSTPGALFNLGSTSPSSDHFENLHSCKFNVDESCIATGMEIFSQTVIDYLGK
ncbi:M20 metallopeptidase family protein [Acetivibrio cellulolyticus]|uniref:M20 metallopeptidase family protein n=1 Tax=Acetivibrio cellulolyticus TaxID=35830 RepID=UPI0001E2D4E4|nr:amidohydrolase [Acetivibrio cellulolyticus]